MSDDREGAEERSSASLRICLLGASGLVGQAVIAAGAKAPGLRLTAISRREIPLPEGARMEVLLDEPSGWPDLVRAARPDVVICALGTTLRKAGSKEAFRAVDHDLVLDLARAAREAGADHFILVSSTGADAASGNFYLRTKGEVEQAVQALGFARVDVMRPGVLRGPRSEFRPMELVARITAPAVDLAILRGQWRRFRSMPARRLAAAMLALTRQREPGVFVHDWDAVDTLLREAA
ncbi:NAD(P)H-binding protein [Novosphingobium sp. 9]|uniref:NAD(P)H-binding protein n=1 Tax=Novosphingobium sp. 9 TaxID=2025349 RepID=UPI0021B55F50|nr:NAD(P)H-binding protein [Novosphingobium sp. 9]